MALIDMDFISGDAGNPELCAMYGFAPYEGRVVYKSGGFYVDNGVCYVDAVYTTTTSLAAQRTVFGGGTTCAVASSQGTALTTLGDVNVRYDASNTEQFYTKENVSSGTDLHFVGNFKTTAPNTKYNG